MSQAPQRRVGVTGAAGRLGSALVDAFSGDGWAVMPWKRTDFDLDDPYPVGALMGAERPDLVVHAAAWTDVDGCAREPELAMARNAVATRVLAEACHAISASLLVVSTNEVFDGMRSDGVGYGPTDEVHPANAYGRSKLAAEEGAIQAFGGLNRLGVVRTAWLFGPGKPDFPARIAAAAHTAIAEGRPMRLVSDEVGTPTFVPDLAAAIVRLAVDQLDGIHHVVNAGIISRADWARDVFERLGIEVAVQEISLDEHERPSRPPRWGVLAPTPLPGEPLRHWREAMAERLAAAGAAT